MTTKILIVDYNIVSDEENTYSYSFSQGKLYCCNFTHEYYMDPELHNIYSYMAPQIVICTILACLRPGCQLNVIIVLLVMCYRNWSWYHPG